MHVAPLRSRRSTRALSRAGSCHCPIGLYRPAKRALTALEYLATHAARPARPPRRCCSVEDVGAVPAIETEHTLTCRCGDRGVQDSNERLGCSGRYWLVDEVQSDEDGAREATVLTYEALAFRRLTRCGSSRGEPSVNIHRMGLLLIETDLHPSRRMSRPSHDAQRDGHSRVAALDSAWIGG